MKKQIAILLAIVLSTGILAGCSGSSTSSSSTAESNAGSQESKPAETIKLVVAHNQTNMDSPFQTGLLKFKESLESKDLGFEVEVHAGTLGTDERELTEKMTTGAADIVVVSPGFLTQTGIKEIDMLAFPYLFRDFEHWDKVTTSDIATEISDLIYEKSGNTYKILSMWSAGVRHYYGKVPVNSPADMNGLKYRTQTAGIIAEYWKEIGAIPTNVAWGELYQALQQKTVDASENAYPFLVPQSHHKTENGKYISETGHDITTRFLIMNANKLKSFTEEQQAAILEAAADSRQAEVDAINEQEEQYKQQAIEDGAIINEVDKAPFMEVAEEINRKYAEKIGVTELYEKILNLK